MIPIMFAMIFLQAHGIFITNLSANALPWNVSMLNGNLTQAPNIVIDNLGWFFPAVTLMFLLMTDYILGIKKGVDLKNNFIVCAIAYTMLSYIEVVGSISTSNYFYIFEFIMLIALTIMSLWKQSTP